MTVTEFNNNLKSQDNSWIFEEYVSEESRNLHIAFLYLQQIAQDLGYPPQEIEFLNSSKKPKNHFQLKMYLDNTLIWATFVYVETGKKYPYVLANRSNIELLDEDYNLIKKIH